MHLSWYLFPCSAEMLVNLAIPWVIIGHSERRSLLNESNEVTPARMETSGQWPHPYLYFVNSPWKKINSLSTNMIDSKIIPPSFWLQFVGDKVAYALSQGIKVIACVGETLEQRESGSTMEVVAAQTKAIAGVLLLLSSEIESKCLQLSGTLSFWSHVLLHAEKPFILFSTVLVQNEWPCVLRGR